ncbi:hypothetical protein MXB_1156, partial [Myxobolus squamalis]
MIVQCVEEYSSVYFGKLKLECSLEATKFYQSHLAAILRKKLLATSIKLVKYFNQLSIPEFARAGAVATKSIILSQGQSTCLNSGPYEKMKFTMEVLLRKLLVPVSVKNGVINLENDFQICSEGDILTPNQSSLLKLFGHKLANFNVKLIASWHKDKEGRIIHH